MVLNKRMSYIFKLGNGMNTYCTCTFLSLLQFIIIFYWYLNIPTTLGWNCSHYWEFSLYAYATFCLMCKLYILYLFAILIVHIVGISHGFLNISVWMVRMRKGLLFFFFFLLDRWVTWCLKIFWNWEAIRVYL